MSRKEKGSKPLIDGYEVLVIYKVTSEQTVFAEVYCAKKQRKIDTKQIAITGRLYLNFKAKSTRFRRKDGTFLFWIVPPLSFL